MVAWRAARRRRDRRDARRARLAAHAFRGAGKHLRRLARGTGRRRPRRLGEAPRRLAAGTFGGTSSFLVGDAGRRSPGQRTALVANARGQDSRGRDAQILEMRSASSMRDRGPTIGGSADLTHSNFTKGRAARWPSDFGPLHPLRRARIRHGGSMNGIALHGGFVPYGGTFLVFSDYARGAIRLSALMGLRVIYVLTHDSIGLGEDGPTHRRSSISPRCARYRIVVFRPPTPRDRRVLGAGNRPRPKGPTSTPVLSRQNLPQQAGTPARAADVARGGYVLVKEQARR